MLFKFVSVFYGYIIVHSVLVSADVFDATFDITPNESRYATCRAKHGFNFTVNIGDTLRVGAENPVYINMFECSINNVKILSKENNTDNSYNVLGVGQRNQRFRIDKETKISESSIGRWYCSFYTFKDNKDFHNITWFDKHSYVKAICIFDVTINQTSKNDALIDGGSIDKNTLIYIGIGTLVGTIFLVQTGVIIYFKTKASRISRLDRLSTNRPDTEAHNDHDNKRYCLTPGQRGNKLSRFLRRRNSKDDNEVYETLEDVQLNALNLTTPPIEAVPKMLSAIQVQAKEKTSVASQSPSSRIRSPIPPPITEEPPEPPRISTIPRRHANDTLEKDISNRPPLPLPTEKPDQANQNTIERVPRKMPEGIRRPIASPMMDAVTAEMKLPPPLKPSSQRVFPPPITDHQPGTPPSVRLPPKPKPAPPPINNSLPRVPNKPVVIPKPAPEKPGPIAPVVSELDNIFKKRQNGPTATAGDPLPVKKPSSTLNLPKKPAEIPSTNHSLPRVPNKPVIPKPAQDMRVPAALPPMPVPPKPQQPLGNPVKPTPKPPINKPVPPPSTSKVAKPPMLSPPPSHGAPQFQLPNTVLPKPKLPPPSEEIYEEYIEEEEEEHIYNESADPIYNSDDEWTYEALPQYNIYSR